MITDHQVCVPPDFGLGSDPAAKKETTHFPPAETQRPLPCSLLLAGAVRVLRAWQLPQDSERGSSGWDSPLRKARPALPPEPKLPTTNGSRLPGSAVLFRNPQLCFPPARSSLAALTKTRRGGSSYIQNGTREHESCLRLRSYLACQSLPNLGHTGNVICEAVAASIDIRVGPVGIPILARPPWANSQQS